MAGRGRQPRNVNRRGGGRGPAGPPRDPRDDEIERLQQRIQELELRYEEREEETESELFVDNDSENLEENPFGRPHQPFDRSPPRQVRQPFHDDPLRGLGMKVEIPEFEGKAQPDDFIDWLSTVERVFELKEIPDNIKVKVVAIKLRRYASLWWDHVRKTRAQEGKSKVETWAKMKKLLQAKFLPLNY